MAALDAALGEIIGAIGERGFTAHVTGARRRITELVRAEDEELGYRTLGWPPRHEEIGLYFEGWGGVIELGLYRARSRRAAPPGTLPSLPALRASLAAAYERHQALPRRQADW